MQDENKILKETTAKAFESTAMPEKIEKIKETSAKKEKNLRLDIRKKSFKTRGELYTELSKDDKKSTGEEIFIYANPLTRGLALLLDGIFIFSLLEISKLIPFVETKVIYYFLNRYGFQLWISEQSLNTFLIFLNFLGALFFLVVIPTAILNFSFGKKLTGLRVRGDERYKISIGTALRRELIYKPLGIVFLIGFIFPFFNEKRKSFHDKMSKTFVMKKST